MSSRYLAPLVFATAALASIGTSQRYEPANWELIDEAVIESVTIGPDETLSFGITGQASGPANGHNGGDISVTLVLAGAPIEFDRQVTVVFASLDGDPARRDEQIVVVSPEMRVTLTAPAWVACEAGPCFDDFQLTISGVAVGESLSVQGSVAAVLRGLDPTPSPDHAVAVEVTRL